MIRVIVCLPEGFSSSLAAARLRRSGSIAPPIGRRLRGLARRRTARRPTSPRRPALPAWLRLRRGDLSRLLDPATPRSVATSTRERVLGVGTCEDITEGAYRMAAVVGPLHGHGPTASVGSAHEPRFEASLALDRSRVCTEKSLGHRCASSRSTIGRSHLTAPVPAHRFLGFESGGSVAATTMTRTRGVQSPRYEGAQTLREQVSRHLTLLGRTLRCMPGLPQVPRDVVGASGGS